MSEFYIQSFNEYAHEFKTKTGPVVIPPITARPKNIATITQEQFDELEGSPEFTALMSAKKSQFRKLDNLPRNAVDFQDRITQANDDVRKAQVDADIARREADAVKRELEKVKRDLAEAGGALIPDNTKLAEAESQIELANKERDDALAELAELKAKKKAKAE
jgi:chromosome segregation ATPase